MLDVTRAAISKAIVNYERRNGNLPGASGTNWISSGPYLGGGKDSSHGSFGETQSVRHQKPCQQVGEHKNRVHLSAGQYCAKYQFGKTV